MKQLLPGEYPTDFHYHRTSSPTYRKYLENCGPTTFDTTPPDYAWMKSFFSGGCHITKFERIDVEPDIEKLRAIGMKHAMVTWIPYQRQDIPAGWRRLYLTDHFQNTGYTRLDGIDYKKHWNDRAKRAQKKFEKSGAKIECVTAQEFAEAFQKTKVKHWYKSDYIRYYKKLTNIDPSSVRQWVVRDTHGVIVAGLAVHDYLGNHSVHLVAFTGKAAYDIQGGTGLIDEWFRDSQEKGMKYLTFDQLRNPHGPSEQKGYTEFKENFIEHKLTFPKAYFRLF